MYFYYITLGRWFRIQHFHYIHRILIVLTSIPIFLLGCSEKENQSPITFNHNGQEFTIIPLYQEYLNYIEDAKGKETNLDALYEETVKQSFAASAFGEEFKDWEIEDWTFSTPTFIDELEESLQLLIENHEKIVRIIKETLKDSSDKLPGGKKSVYIIPANPTNASTMEVLNGVTGVTWEKDVILLQIEPAFLEEEYLMYCLAHEYHHSVYMENNELDYTTTLLEDVILEGKADTFAKSLYPDVTIPWHEFSTVELEANTWEFLKKNGNSTALDSKEVSFVGNQMKEIPSRANYTIGYKIMEHFIEHNPNISIAEWTNLSAQDVLVQSKYEESFSN